MKICLCDNSALCLWRHFDNRVNGFPVFGHTAGAGPTLLEALPSKTLPSSGSLEGVGSNRAFINGYNFDKWGIQQTEKIDLLVSRSCRNQSAPLATIHSCSSALPKNAMLRVDHGVFVISPEHLFVRMARKLDFVDLLKLGYELCGCYSIRPDVEAGLTQRHPLCTPSTIKQFLSKSPEMPGSQKARKALPFLQEGSGSPQETNLSLLFCLPMRYGGFGLPFPKLNVSLDLGKDGRLLWAKGNAFDLVWEKERLVVEYDGQLGHASPENKERDLQRRDALTAAGYHIIVVTKAQTSTVSTTYGVANATATRLGIKLRFRSAAFGAKHRALWSTLFRGSHNFGC